MMSDPRPSDRKASTVPTISRVLSDGTIIETLYRPDEGTTAFAVWRSGSWTIERDLRVESEQLVPFSPRNNLIKNEAVLLPSEPLVYGTQEELLAEIQHHIHRYADLSPSFEKVASHF